ncbi:Neprilysin-2 [Nymphon striatum]|nr:Neprilysin-2 [Nymphon striatum]
MTAKRSFFSALYAGVLQDVMYMKNRPHAMNLGGAGFVIGHEISHGFDNRGSTYAADGTYTNWWSNSTKLEYDKKVQCFKTEYGKYDYPHVENKKPGMKLNDGDIVYDHSRHESIRLIIPIIIKSIFSPQMIWCLIYLNTNISIGEIMGDFTGIESSYHFLNEYLKAKGSDEKKHDSFGYTDRQLFWIAYGQAWCNKITVKEAHRQWGTYSHPPGEIRVNGPLKHSQQFSKDFGCKTGDEMNPKVKCSLWE